MLPEECASRPTPVTPSQARALPRCATHGTRTMRPLLLLLLLLLTLAATALAAEGDAAWPASGSRELEVRMPPMETPEAEAYLCTSAPLPGDGGVPLRLTGVRPLSSANTVHHMLLFGE